MNPTPPSNDSFLRIDAAAAADGSGLAVGPVSVLFRLQKAKFANGELAVGAILEVVGSPSELDTHPWAGRAERLDCPGRLLMPGLVNAHCHLDLTHIGHRPFDPLRAFGGFVD